MTPSERLLRAGHATEALNIFDTAFDAVITQALRRMRDIARDEPGRSLQMSNMAVTANIAEEVRDIIRAIAADGPVAENELKRLRNIEAMSPERRKVLGISLPTY